MILKQGIAVERAVVDAILADTGTDGVVEDSQTTARKRLAGVEQTFVKTITSAANAGDVVVATFTTQASLIESIVIHSNAVQTGDLTSCGIFGGVGKVITFIPAAEAIQANLDAAHKQVGWTGAVWLREDQTIVISLVGTGATAVNLTIVIKSRATWDGGYLA